MHAEDAARLRAPVKTGYRFFLLVLLFFSLYLVFGVIKPFLHTLVFAVLLASLFGPVHAWILKRVRGRKNAAAVLTVVLVTFLIALPSVFFATSLVAQGIDSISRVTEWIRQGNLQKVAAHPKVVQGLGWLQTHLTFVDFSKLQLESHLLALSKNVGQFLINRGAGLLGDAATVVTRFFLLIFFLFYLLRDGTSMIAAVKALSPLREDQEDRILQKMQAVARSALLGSFLTAVAQGVAGGVGLVLVGIPGLFWGTLMGFTSFIPVVGTALVWVPAALYLVLLGRTGAALFLTLWSVILVGSIDNFLRPFFMKGQAGMSTFYIFLAILGGMQWFGLAGIVYGPLILAFAMVMLYIYQVEYRDMLEEPLPPTAEPSRTAESPPTGDARPAKESTG
uniref:AI-2E family transporter n=1 Tax=Desulfacinum infernum TaxID=35837 RepID=A0A832A6B9_9BACT